MEQINFLRSNLKDPIETGDYDLVIFLGNCYHENFEELNPLQKEVPELQSMDLLTAKGFLDKIGNYISFASGFGKIKKTIQFAMAYVQFQPGKNFIYSQLDSALLKMYREFKVIQQDKKILIKVDSICKTEPDRDWETENI